MATARKWALSLCVVLWSAAAADAQVFEWVPIAASGGHTVNGNEIVLEGGGQTVTLHYLVSGWDSGSSGVLLGSFQGTIDPTSYLGANASPPNPGVDLNPLGSPFSPEDGAFQALSVCGSVECVIGGLCVWDPLSTGAPCPPALPAEIDRPDWVFAGGDYNPAVTTNSLSYIWLAASTTCAADPDGGITKFYGGTLILEVPVGAQGSYTISWDDDYNFTLAGDCVGVFMTPLTLVPAQITISCAADADCDDANACTDDRCESDETCSNTPNYDDAVYCCDPLTGELTPIDDDNDCTEDICNPDGTVDHIPTPGVPCGEPPVGECDVQDTCNAQGQCAPEHAPGSTPCGDPSSSECDRADACDGSGSCQPNYEPPDTTCGDPTDDDCTDPDTCDGMGACQANDAPNGTPCDDLDACTEGETCTVGVCGSGTAVDCDDGLDCTTDTCAPGTGLCENALDPGNCLIDGACYAGGDFNPTDDCEECDPASSLAWSFRDAGQECDDGDPCTGTGRPGIGVDTCDGAGFCLGLEDPECNDTCPFAIEAVLGVTFSNNDNRGPDDAEASCQEDSNNDVWFVFTAICDGEVLATTTGSTFGPSNDPVLSVWDECPGEGGGEIACDDDSGVDLQAALTFPAMAGEDYYLRVAGFENNSGNVELNVSTVDDCVIGDVCYEEGELNPDNECQSCIPALSTTEFSAAPEGTACGDPADTVCDSPDACDGNGVCEVNPKPDGTECPDDENVCTFDVCAAGLCSHPPTPPGVACGDQTDTECDIPDTCDGAGGCLDNFEGVGAPCGDPSQDQCDNPNICDGSGSCDDNFAPVGTPCDDGDVCTGDDICAEGACAGTAIANQPIVVRDGPKAISVVAQPVTPTPPVALTVTSPDWPCLDKYVTSMECTDEMGITSERVCGTDADCNDCSFTFTSCLTDTDCDFGLCADGRYCSVAAQDCLGGSTCVLAETCVLSGESCEPALARTIDVNGDGLVDGLRATLSDDPQSALVLPLEDWTAHVMRCSKSAAPCVGAGDCIRGVCDSGIFCNVVEQNCLDGSTCVLDELCLPGRVFLTGPDIIPGTQYDVRAECGPLPDGRLSEAGSAATCLWADVTCDDFINVRDVQLVVRGIQGVFEYVTLVQLDIHPCHPQRILNVSDVQMVLLAMNGQTYNDTGCPVPCS